MASKKNKLISPVVSAKKRVAGEERLQITLPGDKQLKSEYLQMKLQLEQKRQHEKLLLETALQLSISTEIRDLLSKIADGAMRILEATEADIYLLSKDRKVLDPMIAIGPAYVREILNTPLDVANSLTGKAVKMAKSLIVNDVLVENSAFQIPGTPVDSEERLVVVPIKNDQIVIGAFCVSRFGKPFSDEDLMLAEAYGALASATLKNMRDEEERKKAEEKLRESESKYRELVDSLPNIFYELDLEGKFTFSNRYGLELSGYTQKDIDLGLPALELFHPKDHERVKENIARILQGENVSWQEYTALKKNGETFSVLANSRIILKDGKPAGLRGFLVDVTERRQMEKDIHDSELRYRLLTELNPDVIAIHINGKIVYVNPACVKLLGADASDAFIGRSFLDLLASHDPGSKGKKIVKRILERRYSPPSEEKFIRVDGHEVDVEMTSIPITLQDQPAMLVVAHNITDRKKSERELRESERRYQTLANMSPVGIFHTNSEGFTTYVNPAWCQIAGVSFEDALGNGWLKAVHPEDKEKLSINWQVSTRRQAASTADYRFMHLDGSVIWVIGQAVPEIDSNNRLIGYVGTITDITDHIRDQQIILRSNNDLIAAYEATLEGWSHALEIREHDTAGHCKRVAELTVRLAKTMGIADEELIHIRRGAILHDIGKMAIPDRILLKPDPLTDEEWIIMRQHPIYAHELLSSIEYLTPALDIPILHHERYDGSGYPYGLIGEKIPLAVRIFSVVDEWDALISDRPYRRAWTMEAAKKYLFDQKFKEFDPRVVDEFLKTI